MASQPNNVESEYVDSADVPSIEMADDDVEVTEFAYSTRHPDDWVISGPLNGRGPGRQFDSWSEATAWAREFYGARFKGPVAPPDGNDFRWAFLIRGPRGG